MSANTKDMYVEANSDDENLRQVGDEMGMGEEDAVPQHVSRNIFKNAQRKFFDIEVVATPNQLKGNSVTWKVAPHLSRELKHNLATVNKKLAGDEHLQGDLRKCIPLGMQVVQHSNGFPFAMGIKVADMVDTNLHATGQCVWRVPANTGAMPVGLSVFEPNTPVTQWMYDKQRMCSLEDLARDVQYHPATAKGKNPVPEHYMVTVDSFAYNYMADELAAGKWEDQLDHIDVDHVLDPGRSRKVMVSKKIGDDVLAMIKPQLVEASAGFMNLDEFSVEIVRTDQHENFATPKGIAGMVIGDAVTEPRKVQSELMNTVCTFNVKVAFDYILLPGK